MKKIKQGKITLTISIACTAFILTMVMFTQFKTVKETDITGIEVMREAELRTELASWKSKYEEANLKLEDIENKIDEYNSEIQSNNNITSLLQEELEEVERYVGYTDVSGEGIIVTLSDTDISQIEAADLIELVQALKLAGAEAISINDERIVATTDISDVNYQYIFINTANKNINRISSPYIVKAIGNKKYLESAISVKYGFLDEMKSVNKDVTYVVDNNVQILKYNGSLEYVNAKIKEN